MSSLQDIKIRSHIEEPLLCPQDRGGLKCSSGVLCKFVHDTDLSGITLDEIKAKLRKKNKEQPQIVDLKPPTQFETKPLSISQIDSFRSDDGSGISPQSRVSSRLHLNLHPSTNRSRSLYAKAKLQRVVSRRFGENKNLVNKALSNFLRDEEFDEKAMRTDLLDPEGYIISHLTIKFSWDQKIKEQFFEEVNNALIEAELSRTQRRSRKNSRKNSKSRNSSNQGIILPFNDTHRSDTQRTTGSLHLVDYGLTIREDIAELEHKYDLPLDNDDYNIVNYTGTPITISLKGANTDINIDIKDTDTPEPEVPPNNPLAGIDPFSDETVLSPDDPDDEVGINVTRTYTQAQRSIEKHVREGTPYHPPKRTRYPEYVIKAIFYAADDEHVEVLLDQAINFIANDPRFNYLWYDENYVKLLYSDKTYPAAVEKLMREIIDIAHKDGADFFHHFVDREYDRERKDYLRDLLNASENKSFQKRARGVSSHQFDADEKQELSRTFSISARTQSTKYTLKYNELMKEEQGMFDISFKIRKYVSTDDRKYVGTKPQHFVLPNCAPNSKFMWAQYQRKKIKRFDKGNKAHGYWKLLRAENDDDDDINTSNDNINNGEIEMKTLKKKKKKKKKGKKPPIPVQHLNLILGLVRFYLRQKALDRDQTWIYSKCDDAFTFVDIESGDRRSNKKDIAIHIANDIESFTYKLSWYNGGDGFDQCVAFAIRKELDPNKFYFYLCFKADLEDKIEWQWYNNDESYFQKYELGFATFAQLEASFQANLHTNFPFNIMPSSSPSVKIEESPFNLPCIPEMVKAMKENNSKSSAQHYIIRYLFTKSRRIQDMEQLSVNKYQPEYPRRIKRMIAGTNQNTLFAYFLKDSDFVNEWKERFLLSEETQVYYFWSFILSIAATMKYMELELENQFITFSFRRAKNPDNSGVINSLDTSDLRREMRDLDLFEGFIVPPLQIMQTQDVWNAEDQLKPRDWYRTLSTVGILTKRKYFDNFGGTLHKKPTSRRFKNQEERYDTCPHDFHRDDYPWKGQLGTLYCDRCANMMRFGEYLRKFCLEYENRELIQFLWPWHKNTFHQKDTQKYHEAIARENFNFLFDSEDLLNYVPMESNQELIRVWSQENDEDNEELDDRSRSLSKGGKQHKMLKQHQLTSNVKQLSNKMFEAHIRHKRKYAARFMLGAWGSLKNLNIIKVQMGAVLEQLEIDRVHAEVAAAAKESIDVKFYKDKLNTLINHHQLHSILNDNNDNNKDDDDFYEAKQWQLAPKDWPDWLSQWNAKLKERLRKNHFLMILKLNKFKSLEVANISPKQLPNWDSFLTWTLSPIYRDTLPDTAQELEDDDSLIDPEEVLTDSDQDRDEDEYKALTSDRVNRIKSEATLQKAMMTEWQKRFRKSWTRVPSWWHIGHDKVLIELAVSAQFNERKYYRSLTKRGAYYRMRLNQSIGEQDYTQDVAFQEFKNWCIRWENIMHRVRYISSVVARQLSSIQPSIVELMIDDRKDRPTWSCDSLVFLNDNQRVTHIQRIIELPKPIDFARTIKEKQCDYDDEEEVLLNSDDDEDASDDDILAKFQNQKSVARLAPKFRKSKTQFIREEIDKLNKIDWAQLFKECRIRDPFMIRDLGFELKEILNTFDLVTYGEAMSAFVIELLRTRNLRSLWTFLGVLLKTMPNKTSLKILYRNRTQLRRAKPSDLDWICRQVIQGTRFIVPACLFLSHFMRENAKDDLARNGVWESFSKQYEEFAAEQVSSIEDDFMLAMLMFIPVYMKEISLIQLALEQHNTLFLNTERVNRMITHTWFSANPLNPHIEMISHNKNPKRNLRDAFIVLTKKPIYFYLTPFGYQWCISLLFTVYVCCIVVFVAIGASADHTKHGALYEQHMSWFERIVWFCNFGFIITEGLQYVTLGRAYFSVDGATNLWDILMGIIWIILAVIRFLFYLGYPDYSKQYKPPASSFTRRRRLIKNDIYCPPNFFSCKIVYNKSCIAEVRSKDNEIVDFECDDDNDYRKRRKLFDADSNSVVADAAFDIAYDEEDASRATVDANGNRCYTANYTVEFDEEDYVWDERCSNYYDDTAITNNTNTTNTYFTTNTISDIDYNISNGSACVLINFEVCDNTFDSRLQVSYNVLWAVQVSMLTMRLLSYFESAGGFFGILLRIVRSMMIEVLKFGVIIIIVTMGFLFAIWALFSVDIDTEANNTFMDLYDVVIFFFKLLFGGGNVGTIDTFYQNYRVFAQLIIMVFAILGVRMFMSLLIALMSGAMNRVRSKAKSETSFTSALYAYELSSSPRIMPMPLNLVVVILSLIIHILNFLTAIISPNHLNIYAHMNQKRLYGFDCCLPANSRKRELKCINHMNTRRRVFWYYIYGLIPCLRKYIRHNWKIHHTGCYNAVIGIYGTEEIQAVSTNEYYSVLETKRKKSEENRKLNVYDKLFLKHLTLKTLFCKFCFRPIALEQIRSNLLTPFETLTNIVSCYIFLVLWPFLIPFFWILCQIERLIEYWTEELRAHSPNLLLERHRDYDLEYFPRSAVKPLSVRSKTRKDFRRLGTGGPDVTDVDVNYDEMDDAGE